MVDSSAVNEYYLDGHYLLLNSRYWRLYLADDTGWCTRFIVSTDIEILTCRSGKPALPVFFTRAGNPLVPHGRVVTFYGVIWILGVRWRGEAWAIASNIVQANTKISLQDLLGRRLIKRWG